MKIFDSKNFVSQSFDEPLIKMEDVNLFSLDVNKHLSSLYKYDGPGGHASSLL